MCVGNKDYASDSLEFFVGKILDLNNAIKFSNQFTIGKMSPVQIYVMNISVAFAFAKENNFAFKLMGTTQDKDGWLYKSDKKVSHTLDVGFNKKDIDMFLQSIREAILVSVREITSQKNLSLDQWRIKGSVDILECFPILKESILLHSGMLEFKSSQGTKRLNKFEEPCSSHSLNKRSRTESENIDNKEGIDSFILSDEFVIVEDVSLEDNVEAVSRSSSSKNLQERETSTPSSTSSEEVEITMAEYIRILDENVEAFTNTIVPEINRIGKLLRVNNREQIAGELNSETIQLLTSLLSTRRILYRAKKAVS